jgi:hypothetical protein
MWFNFLNILSDFVVVRHYCILFQLAEWLFLICMLKWNQYGSTLISSMVSPTSGKSFLHSCQHTIFMSFFFLWLRSWCYPLFRCMLHNFAADFEMYGVLDAVASGPIDARLSENSTMVYIISLISCCCYWTCKYSILWFFYFKHHLL